MGPPADFGIVRARGDDHRRQAGGGRGAGARRGRRGGGARAHGPRSRPRHHPGRRGPRLAGVRAQQDQGLRGSRHGLVPRADAGDVVAGRCAGDGRALQRGRPRRRDPGAVAPAGRARFQAGARADRPGEGRRRIPPAERRPPGGRSARPGGLHARRGDGAARRDRRAARGRATPSSSAAPTSSASRSRCSCCIAAPPSRSATRARATSPRSPAGPTCWWPRSAGRA